MRPALRLLGAGLLGLLLFFAANRVAVWWLGATAFSEDSFYDGCCGVLTLAAPALLGGFVLGLLARGQGLNVAAAAFLLVCLAGFLHPVWRVPPVSAHAPDALLLVQPAGRIGVRCARRLAGGQFATGKFTLADREPVTMPGLED